MILSLDRANRRPYGLNDYSLVGLAIYLDFVDGNHMASIKTITMIFRY